MMSAAPPAYRAARFPTSLTGRSWCGPKFASASKRRRAQLGYGGPDPKGRLLKEGRFNAIGFMPPGAYAMAEMIRSPYGRELLLGAALACDAAGATLSLVNGTDDTRMASIREALVDGFILGHAVDIDLVTSAQRRRLPFVILESDAGPDVNSIKIDGRSGALAVIRHLTALGHQKFAILSVRRTAGPAIVHMPGETNRALATGFCARPRKARRFQRRAGRGRPVDRRHADHRNDARRSPRPAPLCSTAVPEATAIVTMSDWQAITVLDEAARRGIDVPGHVSVTGFDGTAESARTHAAADDGCA